MPKPYLRPSAGAGKMILICTYMNSWLFADIMSQVLKNNKILTLSLIVLIFKTELSNIRRFSCTHQ